MLLTKRKNKRQLREEEEKKSRDQSEKEEKEKLKMELEELKGRVDELRRDAQKGKKYKAKLSKLYEEGYIDEEGHIKHN